MEAPASANSLFDSFLQLAAGLSADRKLDLIAQLSASVKAELLAKSEHNTFARAFGAFETEQTAEELITELRASRTFTRQPESF